MDDDSTRPAMATQPVSVDALKPKPTHSLPPGYIVLWVITILSLLFNVVVLRQLTIVVEAAQQAVDDALTMVTDLQNTTLSYTATVDDTVPINADLELNEAIPVPIDETLPIKASINVPVKIGPFGSYTVTLPVDGSVPVHTTLNIVINQPFHVSTTVPIHLKVPIQVAIKDTPLADTLGSVRARLEALALRLDRPLLFFGKGAPETPPAGTPSSTP